MIWQPTIRDVRALRMMCGWNSPTMQTATMGAVPDLHHGNTVVCFTYRIDIVKTNDHDKVLQVHISGYTVTKTVKTKST